MNTKENVEYILNTQTRQTQPCDYTANNNLHQTLLQRQRQTQKIKTNIKDKVNTKTKTKTQETKYRKQKTKTK